MTFMRIAATGVVLAVGATAVGCGDSSDLKTTKVTVLGQDKGAVIEDNASRGRDKGDEVSFWSPLVFPGSNKSAGRVDGMATLTQIDKHGGTTMEHRLGTVVYTLSGGTVSVVGAYAAPIGRRAGGGTAPIVGGTGKYESASGSVTRSTLSSGQTQTVLTIKTPKK